MSEELKDHDQKVLDFRTKFLADSEHLLISIFPVKIVELSDLYKSSLFNNASLERVKIATILQRIHVEQMQNKPISDTMNPGTKRTSTQIVEHSTSCLSQSSSRRKRTRIDADISTLDQHHDESDEDLSSNNNNSNNNNNNNSNSNNNNNNSNNNNNNSNNNSNNNNDNNDNNNNSSSTSNNNSILITSVNLSSNAEIYKMSQTIKPFILELIQHINCLKLWIELLIPRIEDGNNFGVSVQEEVLGEVSRSETEASSLLDSLSRYYLSRAKIVSKHLKYPEIEDYRIALQEIDEKKFYSMKILVAELRNIYTTVYDIMLKNQEKFKKPRSTNPSSMY